MAFDAVTVRALVRELSERLTGGRVDKIYQPEKDEIAVNIRTYHEHYRLVLSAGSAHPRIHLTNHSKTNPSAAPMFCMLLRKHLSGGKIVSSEQTGFERAVKIGIESYDELGNLTTKYLISEIMGRHSNIILADEDMKILDCIKRVDLTVSSVRQVLPGLAYTPPPPQDKLPLTELTLETPLSFPQAMTADRALLSSVAGISPLTAREIVYRVFRRTDVKIGELNVNKLAALKAELARFAEEVRENGFSPCVVKDKSTGRLIDFSAVNISQYENAAEIIRFDSVSEMLDEFYYTRDMHERMRQRSAGLTKLLNNNAERLAKKINILSRTLADAENKELYKIKGDLITANLYRIEQGAAEMTAQNYYEEALPEIKIALDPGLSPSQNAQKYYKKYAKAKTAQTEAAKQLALGRAELDYLESVLAAVENAETEQDLSAIRTELSEQGYIKGSRDTRRSRRAPASEPRHFVSSDGFDIYVGRNNTQNDFITTKLANSQDIWFHTKNIHGSHTIIKLGADKNVPPSTIREAARIAAYYSKARESSQVPVDYCKIKNVRKPNGAKPGKVIYDGYNTVYVTPGLIDE